MPDYDFHQLSPDDFEHLTRDLLQAELGIRLESFKSGKDHGIDLRHASAVNGTLIVQCKHYARTGLRGLLRDLRKELPKVSKLAPARYVISTSVPLSPMDKDEIRKLFGTFIQSDGDIFGCEDLNNLLVRHTTIEHQHYKLWLTSREVLDRVLHNAELNRSQFLVKTVYREINKYVPGAAYLRVLDMLQNDNVVVIVGPPGVGITTLANMVLYEYVERGFQAVAIQRDIEEGEKLFQEGKQQIFYFDDFMGSAFLGDQSTLSEGSDKALLSLMVAVRESKTHRFIMTTREHILAQALDRSERLRQSSLSGFQVPLRVQDYSFMDKARILYNHLYFSDLPIDYQDALLKRTTFISILFGMKNTIRA